MRRPAPELDFWFEYGSNYSYLTVMRIVDVAASYKVAIRWRPFLLGPIFRSLGWSGSPFVVQEAKGRYVWQDMVRQCRKYGVPWKRPGVFPRRAVLPLRVALLGAEQPWIGEFSKRMMVVNFALDQEVDNEETVRAALTDLGLDADGIIAGALSEANKSRLREQTETALRLGIFGAPTFFAHGEMFWGNDRLEDALEYAAHPPGEAPFAGTSGSA